MPIYEYRCSGCGEVFDVRHGMDEEPELRCPTCDLLGAAVRQMAAPAVARLVKDGTVKHHRRGMK